jgi:hypothetical protein
MDWPKTLGKLNAALSQTTAILDSGIPDIMKHFVYVPLRVPGNVMDVPTFIQTAVEGDDEEETLALTVEGDDEEEEEGTGAEVDQVESLLNYSDAMMEVLKDYETKLGTTSNKRVKRS